MYCMHRTPASHVRCSVSAKLCDFKGYSEPYRRNHNGSLNCLLTTWDAARRKTASSYPVGSAKLVARVGYDDRVRAGKLHQQAAEHSGHSQAGDGGHGEGRVQWSAGRDKLTRNWPVSESEGEHIYRYRMLAVAYAVCSPLPTSSHLIKQRQTRDSRQQDAF